MNLIKVTEVPKKKVPKREDFSERKSLHNYFKEFMKMNTQYVQVVYSPAEYANHKSALASIQLSLTRCCLPIKVVTREKNIYLVRTDLTD